MKKIYAIILSATLAIGCTDDFINLEPLAQVTSTNFYQNVSDFNLAANGIYSGFQNRDFNVGLYALGELPTQNATVNAPTGNFGDAFYQINDFIVTSDNRNLQNFWQGSYVVINRANILLERSKGVNLNSPLMQNYEGEAYFLRALAYFNLVRVFGDVPLVVRELSPRESFAIGRAPVANIYQQIISDLEFAERQLPEAWQGANIGRATRWAAKTLLAKVYLTQPNKDIQGAITKLQEVQNSNRFDLLADFSSVFQASNANNTESIFEIQFKAGLGTLGSYFADGLAPANRRVNQMYPSGSAGNGQGTGVVTENLFNLYEPNDKRLNATIGISTIGADVIRFQKKYNSPTAVFLDGEDNLIVLRYADVLLLLAEALNEQNNAAKFQPLNQVRQRAGLSPVDETILTSQASFRQFLLEERRREFAFEMQNWFDTVRLGLALSELGPLGLRPHMLIYPIPQREIDVASGLLTQNPGY